MSWQFYNPVKIHFGHGCRKHLSEHLENLSLLIITSPRGRNQLSEDIFLRKLEANNNVTWLDNIEQNPCLSDLQKKINQLQTHNFNSIIAFGGGSAIDAAKAIRLGIAVKGKHSLKRLIDSPELHQKCIQVPLYALPTTSGTGSEVTPFATIWNNATKEKLSLASDFIFPTNTYVDSDLTKHLPNSITLSTGLDAINQAIESIWNRNATPLTIYYATRALELGLPTLPLLAEGNGSFKDRENLAQASLLAGLAISQTRTALCHSISYPLTAHFGVPHGLACAFTMSSVLRYNLVADDGRFSLLAYNLFGTKNTKSLVNTFNDLHSRLKISSLVKGYIPSFNSITSLQKEMISPSRANNNIRDIDDTNLESILYDSWNKD